MGDGLRSIAEGLTFNNAAELEAMLRSAAGQGRYRDLQTRIQSDYDRWAKANEGKALAGELAGAIVPGVVGAFTPGGQGATVSAGGRALAVLPRIGRAMAEPVSMAVSRFVPRLNRVVQAAPRYVRGTVMPVLDELATGVAQSIGDAPTLREAPQQVAEDALDNLVFSLSVRGVNEAGGKARAAYRSRKGKTK